MTQSWRIILNVCMGFMTFNIQAEVNDQSSQPTHETALFTSQVDFGYQRHTGNKDTKSLNFNLQAEYTRGRYRTNGVWKFYRLYKNGDEDKRKSNYELQSDYKIGPKGYLFSSLNGINSKYSAYFKDYTLSAGYGYQLTHTERLTIEIEAGPGYRYQKPNLDEIDDDDLIFPETVREPIVRSNINLKWNMIDDLHLLAETTVVSGKSNTLTTTDISLVTDITQNFATKVTYSRLYHSRVPDGLNKTDTATSVNLVFHF
ncbi:hypothetical protein VQ7734_00774 [Vibrio quintilis]|uniref:Salt-induced outer membrane protein n=2 Tax=Vibrio quintilis TaxID=1117707 RepID=A0A1M7YR48_9VIBR|nr:hypothetical protein VQ7734_00774 [Vibrio quintilis]